MTRCTNAEGRCRGGTMRIALCNEVVRELPFERQCELAATLGYDGLVGAEYRPRASVEAGLGWLRRFPNASRSA